MLASVIAIGVVAYIVATRGDSGPEPEIFETAPSVDDLVAPGIAEPGGTAPGFTATTLEGESVDMADFRGRPVIVNFWASWCFPCREEFPLLREVDDDGEVEVIGIVFNDIASDAEDFAAEMGAEWPQVVDDRGEIARAYGVRSIPRTFFIDSEGTIRASVYGFTEQSFRRHVADLE